MTNGFEKKRLEDLKSFQLLDTPPEKEYDNLTHLASLICDTPISLVSLVADVRQFFKSHHGTAITETPVEHSFCIHAIKVPKKPFILEDARKDDRFRDNPLVKGKPNIVFYAGIPLVSSEGNTLGTFCVIDHRPRQLENKQIESLKSLANQVVQLFELRKNRIKLKEMAEDYSRDSQRLENIINATRVGTWEWDIPRGKVTINNRWAEMLGYSLKDFEPLSIEKVQNLVFPGDSQRVNQKIQDCIEKRIDFYEVECRFVHKKGHFVWVLDRGQIVNWTDDGQPLLMAGTHTDITEFKNTETQFETITNNIPAVVFRYKLYPDGKDELHLVSDGAKIVWGYSSEEIMKNSNLIWGNSEKKDVEALLKSVQKSAENLSFWEHEWLYNHPDGTTRWLKGAGNPTRMKDGSTIWDTIVSDITSQKESELEIEQSEKRFKGLVQNGSDLITIVDFEANFHYVALSSEKILGASPEKFVGKNAFEFIHFEDKGVVHEVLSRLKNKKQLAIRPFRFKHGDGSWRWLEAIVTNQMDDPAIKGLVVNSRDVSERIFTERKLKKSEAYYRGLYESQTNYVIRTDLDGKYTYVNKKFIKEFGWVYPDGEILGESCFSSIMGYHHEKVIDGVTKCLAEPEKVISIEIDKPTINGTFITTLWEFVCVLDGGGNPSEIQCVGLDITDRIKSEEALRESEKRYYNLFHLSPQAKFVYELATLKFLDVNEAAIINYGYSYEEFLKMAVREIWDETETSKIEDTTHHPGKKIDDYLFGEYVHRKKNGEEIIVEVRTNLLIYKGKEARVVIATDITERYKHIRAIESQNQKLKKIAWTQSHVVRAPLARIMGLVELLKVDVDSDEDKEKLLNYLQYSATELDDVIRNIVHTTEGNDILNDD
jgi:PAS domain S-box-containing protein